MFIKTVVDKMSEGVTAYKSYCRADESQEFEKIELHVTEIEYDEAFVEQLLCEISKYSVHTIFTFDYESSSDAGDGRDDYYTEEADVQINLSDCIIKDNQFYGVMCESFERQGFALVEYPETIINHPGNYGGRNYHFYRDKRFMLSSKK